MHAVKSGPTLWLLPAIAILIAVAAPATVNAGFSPEKPRQFGVTATATAIAPQTTPTSESRPTALQSATPAAAPTQSVTLTPGAGLALPTPTPQPPALGSAPALTLTEVVTLTAALTTVLGEGAPPVAQTDGVTVTLAGASAGGPAEGTVIVNRTGALVRYFVEGETRELEPQRSVGLAIERPTAVLNLYNCDAALGDTVGACFWDPYLLSRDGFYEILTGRDAGAVASLVLREAGGPPVGEVWIQNRTSADEEVYFGTQMYTLPVAAIAEFPVEPDGVGLFYLRTCIEGTDGSDPVCEWSASSAEPGAYYAIVSDTWEGAVAGTTITTLTLEPVLGASESAESPAATPSQPQLICRLAVPALNVRSGPGLSFEIVRKVRTSDVDVATVVIVARTEDTQWLKVDERVATGGWVTSDDEFLTCDGDVNALPIIESSLLPATPTPTPAPAIVAPPAPIESAPVESAPVESAPAEGEVPAEVLVPTAPAPLAIPAGQGLLVVTNGFDQIIRFTLDQTFRVELGASEVDLAPGQSATFIVFPGTIRFSVSSPWRALAGNAELFLEPDTQRSLWIAFIPDEGEPGNFVLTY